MSRNKRSYRGLNLHRTTYLGEEALIKALEEREDCNTPLSVVLVADGTVGLGKAEDKILGFAYVCKDDGNVGVIDEGYVCDVIGEGLKVGDGVVADGKGGVKKATTAKPSDLEVRSISDHDGTVVVVPFR